MLKLELNMDDYFDENTMQFYTFEPVTLTLRHCLRAMSDWEAIHEKPFLSEDKKTNEEMVSYVECMMIDHSDEDKKLISKLSKQDWELIQEYLSKSHTATTVSNMGSVGSRQITTTEVLYAYMAMAHIPFEADLWYFNRLNMTLQVYGALNSPKKKMDRKSAMAQQRSLNSQRRAKYNTKG